MPRLATERRRCRASRPASAPHITGTAFRPVTPNRSWTPLASPRATARWRRCATRRFRCCPGEVHALMGANGAGKSTLVKILTGAIRPDAGRHPDPRRGRDVHSPADARRAGLVSVYQEPSLIPDLDIAVQSAADRARRWSRSCDWVRELGVPDLDLARDRARHAARRAARARSGARAGDRARRAAARRDDGGAAGQSRREGARRRPPPEPGRPLRHLHLASLHGDLGAVRPRHGAARRRDRRRRRHGAGRRGEDRRADARRADRAAPVRRRARGDARRRGGRRRPSRASRVRNLARRHQARTMSPSTSRDGEVAGVVALEGQGQDELFGALSGSIRPSGGTIEVDGKAVQFAHPADAIRAGIAYVPGDRTEALLMQRSVRENIALPFSARLARWGPIDMRRERRRVDGAIERLQIDTRAQREVQRLSGGNQQKVTIARWIAAERPHHPVLRPDARHRCRAPSRRSTGCCASSPAKAPRCSSTPPSWRRCSCVCDRAIVIFGGRVVDILPAEIADEAALMRAAYGLPRDAQRRCRRARRCSARRRRHERRHEPLRCAARAGSSACSCCSPAPVVVTKLIQPGYGAATSARWCAPCCPTPSPSRPRPSSSSPAASTSRSPR